VTDDHFSTYGGAVAPLPSSLNLSSRSRSVRQIISRRSESDSASDSDSSQSVLVLPSIAHCTISPAPSLMKVFSGVGRLACWVHYDLPPASLHLASPYWRLLDSQAGDFYVQPAMEPTQFHTRRIRDTVRLIFNVAALAYANVSRNPSVVGGVGVDEHLLNLLCLPSLEDVSVWAGLFARLALLYDQIPLKCIALPAPLDVAISFPTFLAYFTSVVDVLQVEMQPSHAATVNAAPEPDVLRSPPYPCAFSWRRIDLPKTARSNGDVEALVLNDVHCLKCRILFDAICSTYFTGLVWSTPSANKNTTAAAVVAYGKGSQWQLRRDWKFHFNLVVYHETMDQRISFEFLPSLLDHYLQRRMCPPFLSFLFRATQLLSRSNGKSAPLSLPSLPPEPPFAGRDPPPLACGQLGPVQPTCFRGALTAGDVDNLTSWFFDRAGSLRRDLVFLGVARCRQRNVVMAL